MGMGQNSLKTLPVWAYQGTMTGESMVRLQILRFWGEKRMLPCQSMQWEVATMPYAHNHGIRLHYQAEGAGPTLVLQHGFSDSLESWYEMGYVTPLQQDYRLILIDARGHGASEKPHDPAAYTIQQQAADVVAVLDVLAIPIAHFFGYSMGGRIGFALAKYVPTR